MSSNRGQTPRSDARSQNPSPLERPNCRTSAPHLLRLLTPCIFRPRVVARNRVYIRPAFFDNGRKERKESGVELQRGHLLSPQIKGKEKEKRNAHVSLKRRPQDKSSPNNYPVPERRKQRLKRSTPEQAAAVPRTAAAGNRPAVSAAAADTHHHPGNHSGPAESDHLLDCC